mmetsp:Transcript_60241/g.51029  ORF Transcript_60241/g.51029 Transcript_60241/m.51029 type:complete len:95 (-) Transcript_60241:88-372(-)
MNAHSSDGWKVLPLRLTQSWIGIRRGSGEEDTLPVELSYASHDAPIECGIHQETIGEIDRNLSNGNLPHSWDVNDIEVGSCGSDSAASSSSDGN